MKRIYSVLAIFTVLTLVNGNLFAQGEATAEFLLIAPGARAGGIGEAGVAIANDAYATYWNPAGLASIKGREFSGMHANWLPQFGLGDMFYDYASYVHHYEGVGTFGFSATYISLGEQAQTDESGQFIRNFDSFNLAIGASYGTALSENLSVGSTFKFIYMKLTDVNVGAEATDGVGSSVAVDLGLLWNPSFWKRGTFGLNIQNLGPKITFVDAAQADPIPTNMKLGVAYKALEQEFNKLTLTVDINKLLVRKQTDSTATGFVTTSDSFTKAIFTAWGEEDLIKRIGLAAGAEYWYADLFALRAGYFYEDIGARRFATFGAGVKYNIYQFDFGYIYSSGENESPLADTMRFSLSFLFN